MKTPALIFIMLLCASCFKMPEDPYVPPVDVPLDFDWKTIEAKNVVLKTTSSILDTSGDTVAYYLPAGEYDIVVGKDETLSIETEPSALNVPTKAPSDNVQRIYFPSKNKYATVMFEDLFPSKGDMDMNDVVFGLNIEYQMNYLSKVTAIVINIQPRAIGGSYEKIGIAANFSSSTALNIIDYITYSNGPELGALFAITNSSGKYSPEPNANSQVVPLTGDYRSYFDNNKDLFLNVRNIDPSTKTHVFSSTIKFKSADTRYYSEFTFLDTTITGKINLDIFTVFNERTKEVHFKSQKPTDRFNTSLFVATRPKTDFSTIDNWVWAIITSKSIKHPIEFTKVYNAYPYFKLWVESSGGTNVNWYSNSVKDSLYSKTSFSYIN